VCDKCAIHYANIQQCDYGDEIPSRAESKTKKPTVEKVRRTPTTVPLLPKSRPQPQDLEMFTYASSNWDPFTRHPPSVEPEISLLMGSCKFTGLANRGREPD
jgi:hypothetical protein